MTDPQLVVSPYPGPLALSLVCIDPGPNRPTHRRHLRLGTIRDCIGTKRNQEMEATQVLRGGLTRSRPLIPLLLPAAFWRSFAFLVASCSASFLSIRVFFHTAKVSRVTGVRLVPSLCRYRQEG
jgi:hypothetical protein